MVDLWLHMLLFWNHVFHGFISFFVCINLPSDVVMMSFVRFVLDSVSEEWIQKDQWRCCLIRSCSCFVRFVGRFLFYFYRGYFVGVFVLRIRMQKTVPRIEFGDVWCVTKDGNCDCGSCCKDEQHWTTIFDWAVMMVSNYPYYPCAILALAQSLWVF